MSNLKHINALEPKPIISRHKAFYMAGVAACVMCAPTQSIAQDSAIDTEQIFVTSRKRAERLVDIPLSVQAFTANDLRRAGIDDLEDLTLFSPGLDYNSQSSASFAGRYIPAIRFRGLTTQASEPSNQVGSVFVDGVFVLGGAQSIGFEDIERVEVIKGPQAAYFGRSTFGGAINYITADPADEFGGKISAEYSPTFGTYRFSASLEGPIIKDVLSARITASAFENGAYETATDGGRLGEETTQAIHGSLLYTPTEKLKIKVRASFIEDEDTQPATTIIKFNERGNCPAGTPFTVLDAARNLRDVTLQGAYHCGALPEDVPVTANTRFEVFPARDGLPEADVRGIFVENSQNIPEIDRAPFLDHFGLRRLTVRLATSFEYEISDAFSLAGNLAYNEQDLRRIVDQDYGDAESVYIGAPSEFEDYSGELRVNYDNGGPLRILGGVNYYNQTITAAFGNAVEFTNEIAFGSFGFRVIGSTNAGNDSDQIETFGLFGSIEYDILENLTATFEGRWQRDEVTTFGGQFFAPGDPTSLASKQFLPRGILTYRPVEDMTVYASYSVGTLPGQFNSAFLALSPDAQATVQQDFPTLMGIIPPEKLKSFEVGVKQSLFDGRVSYALAAYFMTWDNLKSAISFLPPGATGLQGGFISGEAEIKGVEFETAWQATEALNLAVTANYTNAEYTDFAVSGLNQVFGLSNADGYRVDGNTLPQTPAWSASFSATYRDQLTAEWDWYTRADVAYQGKAFTDQTNLNWVDNYTLANLRAGVDNDKMSLEFFVTNLFDEGGWVSGATGLDLSRVPVNFSDLFTTRGAVVTAQRGREFGVRASWAF